MSNGVDRASEMSKVLKQIDDRWGRVSSGSPDGKQSGRWESTCKAMNISGMLKDRKEAHVVGTEEAREIREGLGGNRSSGSVGPFWPLRGLGFLFQVKM